MCATTHHMCAMTHHLCDVTHLRGWRDSFMRTSEVSAQSNVNILTKHPNHPGTCVWERDCESHCACVWWYLLRYWRHIDPPWIVYNVCKCVTNGLCVSWCIYTCDMKNYPDIDDIWTCYDSFITFISVSRMVYVCYDVFIRVMWRLVQILTTYSPAMTRL